MQRVFVLAVSALLTFTFAQAGHAKAAGAGKPPQKKMGTRPPVSVSYYLAASIDAQEQDLLRTALMEVKSVKSVRIGGHADSVTVQFDSHVVSYHQIAQAVADTGARAGKQYAPRLKIRVPEYAQGDDGAKVDAVFAGKRLNQRVRIEPTDRAKGEFVVHFLPLNLDASDPAPQGFNGGHLNHPIHDPPPRGLGLQFSYVVESTTENDPAK